MGILLNRTSRVIVQGITGKEGSFHAAQMRDYGTRVVLEANLWAFREIHHGEADAQGLADQVTREIDVWRRYSDWYSYLSSSS